MIISYKYKFIFFKKPRCASTSIQIFLSRFCGSEDIITPHYFPYNKNVDKTKYSIIGQNFEDWMISPQHDIIDIDKFKSIYPELYEEVKNFKMISPIRDPWNLIVSSFWHVVYNNRKKMYDVLIKDVEENKWLQFNTFFQKFIYKTRHAMSDQYYFDDNKKLKYDHVIKFENLKKELHFLLTQLGIEKPKICFWKNNIPKTRCNITPKKIKYKQYFNDKFYMKVLLDNKLILDTFNYKFHQNKENVKMFKQDIGD